MSLSLSGRLALTGRLSVALPVASAASGYYYGEHTKARLSDVPRYYSHYGPALWTQACSIPQAGSNRY